ncbi:MAG: hypothetical protein J6J17_00750 [Bacilli bacterium]|nr:hypothetical protein [Bacilli bacterium]
MGKYIVVGNDSYEIFIPESLQKYGNEVIRYSTDKLEEFLYFLKKKIMVKK